MFTALLGQNKRGVVWGPTYGYGGSVWATQARERSRGFRLRDDVKLMQPIKILSLFLCGVFVAFFLIRIDRHQQKQMLELVYIYIKKKK